MSILRLEENRNKLILALYHLHTKGSNVDTDELEKLADVGSDFYPLLREVGRHGRGWLHHVNLKVRILPPGIQKAEELLNMQMDDKERHVLRKIYDLGGPTHMDWVSIPLLEQELGMQFRELNGILLDFERRKGWVDGIDAAVQLTSAGVREVENPGTESRGGGTTIQNIFHAPVQGGFIQGGQGHTQQNIINNNPKIDETVRTIIELIQESDIDTSDKEDIIRDVERVKELASKEQSDESLRRIDRRIGMVKTGIQAAETVEKGGKLLLKVAPHLATLWQIITAANS
jgi:hypothetical protein